jgi:hypothetical protein
LVLGLSLAGKKAGAVNDQRLFNPCFKGGESRFIDKPELRFLAIQQRPSLLTGGFFWALCNFWGSTIGFWDHGSPRFAFYGIEVAG